MMSRKSPTSAWATSLTSSTNRRKPTRRTDRVVTRRYDTDELTVFWDAQRCIHTGICLRALPDVFDVNARPWVRIDNGSTDAIVAAVEKCPTGALRYERDGQPEVGPVETTMVPIPN